MQEARTPSSRTTTSRSPSVPTLHRNRRLLIAGVITVLPSAAILPSLLGPAKSPALLAAVDQMTTATATVAHENERAVAMAARQQARDAIPQASTGSGDLMVRQIAPSMVPHVDDAPILRMFNGRPVRPARTISMLVTAYSPDERSCGDSADGITASGYSVWTNGMKMVAADTDVLPFGTLVSVPGYDDAGIVPVLDRGGAIKGHRLDVLYPTHERAVQWGAQRLEVTVWEYVDGKPGDFQIASR